MHNLILLVPFIFSIILLISFRKKIVLWEYLVIIGGAFLINIGIVTIMKYSNCDDVEYIGDYVVKAEYYEEWDEWVHRTCTRTDGEGNSETYDCSYCRTNPPYWNIKTKLDHQFNITHLEYILLQQQWKVPSLLVDMNRNYYTKDGNKYEYYWNNKYSQLIPLTYEKPYQNKIKGSRSSIFKFSDVPDSIKINLFEYPKLTTYIKGFIPQIKGVYQNSLLGYENSEIKDQLANLNAYSGANNHIRTYILVFKDKPRIYGHYQKSFWSGGNFNEHVICIGLNSKTNKFDWVETFSWEETPYLSVKSKQWLIENDSINKLNEFLVWYGGVLSENKDWKCRDNEDFNYLDIELTNTQLLWAFIISLLYCVGASAWVILNRYEYKNEE